LPRARQHWSEPKEHVNDVEKIPSPMYTIPYHFEVKHS
jgi:hypothetical protein